MAIYAQTWCPGDPCDPCCYALQASSYETSHDYNEINFDFGTMKLCPKPFVWPFINRTVKESATGNSLGYFPLGVNLSGASIVGGVYQDSIDIYYLSYLAVNILTCTVTHKYIGGNPSGTPVVPWDVEELSSSPAPTDPIQMKYDLALSLANQVGLTIRQYFGDYTQDRPNGPIKLTGFAYSGTVDETQNKVLQATSNRVAGPGGYLPYWLHPVIYYEQVTVPVARVRSRVRLVGQRI